MRSNQDLFTVKYAIDYDGWIKLEDFPSEEQFVDVYLWCNYLVYTRRVNFYLLLKIIDSKGNVIFEGYVKNLYDYSKLKKKLKLTNCTLQNTVYIVDENNTYITDENNNFIIE